MLFWLWRILAELILTFVATLPTQTPLVEQARVWTPSVTITPTPVPTPFIPPTQPTSQLDLWIAQSNWPPHLWSTVHRIVLCESGGIVGIATNPPHKGLMQVNENYWGRVNADAVSELNQGYEIYLQQGFSAWSCY